MGEWVSVWALVGFAGIFLLRRLARAVTGGAGKADMCAGCVHGRDCGRVPQAPEAVAGCSDKRKESGRGQDPDFY
ncbi:MAG: hypothetical protein DRH56_06435 [Deltaproteobacteria bacterium]|nr:MAG: hypothetical protein DRH56_06435 [Deltaproteobacteria bacterium]